MTHIVIFNVVFLWVVAHAVLHGGAPERWTAAFMVAASVATLVRPYDPLVTFQALDLPLFAIDAALLAGFIWVALRAERYWPMWIAALQLTAIAVHIIRAIDLQLVPLVYEWAVGKIAYPMILLLVIGTARHRSRLQRFGSDPDWSRHERRNPEALARTHR